MKDLIVMARQLVVDSECPNRVREGRIMEVSNEEKSVDDPKFEQIKTSYYKAQSRDEKTSRLLTETLISIGLADVILELIR